MVLLIAVTVVLAAVALVLGRQEGRAQPMPPVKDLGSSHRRKQGPWVAALGLFVAQALGVAASFYLVSHVFTPPHNVWLLSVVLAAASFGGGLAARGSRVDIRPAEIFQFFKDGLVWPATLPALAKVLNLPSGS
jgi:hypothetical protein